MYVFDSNYYIYIIVSKFMSFLCRILPYKNGVRKKSKGERVIVSLTSYPARFDSLKYTLKSILYQTKKPDKIIVWLDEYVIISNMPNELIRLERYGIEFRNAPYDLKPHKKYLHAMKEFPDSIIITVDDDIVYPSTMVYSLLKSYYSNPNCVHARRVHQIVLDKNDIIENYISWKSEVHNILEPSHLLFATGVGGVLYPPHCFDDFTLNEKRIEDNCKMNDDIWLKFMELRLDIKVVWAKCRIINSPIINGSQKTALLNTNVHQNTNDEYIHNLSLLFPETVSKLKENINK